MGIAMKRGGDKSRLTLGGLMVSAGVMHFVAPKFYEPLIPEQLGNARTWIYGSGVAEVAAGGLLLNRKTSRLGGMATAAVLVGVFPGNLKMALDAGVPKDPESAFAWLRLPLQVPIVRWALSHAVGPA